MTATPLQYRPEIDGLRAVALLPVILFHAGLGACRGGYVGVDMFFVISGYLITTLIVAALCRADFSLLRFYERRARRILPAMFLVMLASLVFAYLWMLPDELENFGQSLVATALSSNNILLALTSGYWALASEFKPLLHTWSLGVEEQYYLLFPLLLTLAWRFFRPQLAAVLLLLALLSLGAAHWGASRHPDAAFYLLPTRIWELLLGALVALGPARREATAVTRPAAQCLSLLGLCLVLLPVFLYGDKTPNPSLYTLAPTVGTALLIVHARDETLVGACLRNRLAVGVGLISYSAYLWHYPLFAFARIYAVEPPTAAMVALLLLLTFVLAYLSWRFVEMPFRTAGRVRGKPFAALVLVFSSFFVATGYGLHRSHGVPSRMYAEDGAFGADMYISYNRRAFAFKTDSFATPARLKVLVLGSSFARDFVNMTTENFDLANLALIYRDDFPDCFSRLGDEPLKKSIVAAADVIVFASGGAREDCFRQDIDFARESGKKLFYVGTKDFGYNLNWLARLDAEARKNRYNRLPAAVARAEARMAGLIPDENYISLLRPVVRDGQVPVTDGLGRLLSLDRTHLTRQGAQFMGLRALVGSRYGEVLRAAR